ncbi:hypothetical protein [Nocardiopsis sp. JB363]|uniref:hypothetical protein n=1 Tax=Nocardiopsis sp. JB363 TaxID=1434837 RepID=UPI00097AAED4|nr:hypothetical protein [Nocardiopsis sp. JB363]SIO86326.1 hypothetical protein BQ8420_11425 [Nocardiopsis sp. JB363]
MGRDAHGRLTAEKDNGERDLRRRLVMGGALNHGADIGRWRGRADIALLLVQGR